MDEEAEALRVLAKRSFERTPAELQQLAAWLVARCCPFFSSMRPDVVQHLCSLAGHAHLAEGQPAYTQGQVGGDCMYVVVSGYCAVLKHAEAVAQPSSSSGQTGPVSTDGSSADPTATSHSSSRSGTMSHPVSRRATVELQTQQFALATGSIGSNGSGAMPVSRRGTAELSCHGSSSSCVPSRRVSGAIGQHAASRRATAEQVIQQRLQGSAQLGWLTRGDSFGEAALVNPTQLRPVSVVAGGGGAVLMALDRACFNRLQQQAQQEKQPLAAAAVQAVLGAACRPILRVGGRSRTAEDVETLSELIAGLEAFRCMPQPVRARLAKACQGLQLPPGGLVFEEDDRGDAMFVVVSGCLQVRARPCSTLPAAAAAAAADAASLPSASASTTPPAAAAVAACGAGGGSTDAAGLGPQHRRVRATTDAVCAGPAGTGCGGSGAGGGGSSHSRRTTWEGVAFTAKEQGRLEAVKTALQAERVGGCGQQQQRSLSGSGSSSLVERDGLYWTARFMADATTAATSSDPHWGLEGGMTPLAAVFASKWRQQVRQQAVQHNAQAAAADEQAAEDKAFAAMEEMLGKAAARAWKAARDSAASLVDAAAATDNISSSGGGAPAGAAASSSLSSNADDAVAAAGAANEATGGSLNSPVSTVDDDSSEAQTPTADDAAAAAAAAQQQVPCTPRAAAAAAVQLLAAAAASSDPGDALKLHLAALGVRDPADVSRTLMAELGSRAGLEGVLVSLAGYLQHKGLPRRLNKKSSLKITKELNRRMLAGASWQGFGSGSTSNSSSFNQQRRRQQQHQGASVREDAEGALFDDGADDEDELQTEGTGLSSCDWQSSLDASEAASLCAGMHLDDAGEGSLLLDSMGLAGSTEAGAAHHAAPPALQLPAAAGAATDSAAAAVGLAQQPLGGEVLTARFGPVIRTLGTGDSFGELALLQSSATRTATVVVAPSADAPQAGPQAAGAAGALLIKISRSSYDATVRSLQVSALEELLTFLSSLPAFSNLSREALTSLAVFIKPLATQAGQVLAVAGQPTAALMIIQTGEVKLVAQSSSAQLAAGSGGSSAEPLAAHGSIRPTTLGRMRSSSSSFGRGATEGLSPTAARSRRSTSEHPAGGHAGASSGGGGGGGVHSGAGGLSGLPLGVQLTAQQQLSGVQLAILGPGSLLGENVLGYNADEDPLAAIASAASRKARQAATAAASALTHHASAVAATPCKLLVLSADDLRRFGRRVRGPLAEAAAARRDWLQQRIAALQVPHNTSGASAQSWPVAAAGRGVGGSGSSTRDPQFDGLWPGLAGLLAPPGSVSAAVAAQLQRPRGIGGAAAAAAATASSRSQWQQQQWRQEAYGELMISAQRPAQQQHRQQQFTAGDVARMKQLVPAMQPPCVSELAAAARPFPAGMLTAASSVAAAGAAAAGSRKRTDVAAATGGRGLKELLLLPSGAATDLVESGGGSASPAWSVGPGGHLQPAAGGCAGGCGGDAASGRRGPMGRHLECVERE